MVPNKINPYHDVRQKCVNHFHVARFFFTEWIIELQTVINLLWLKCWMYFHRLLIWSIMKLQHLSNIFESLSIWISFCKNQFENRTKNRIWTAIYLLLKSLAQMMNNFGKWDFYRYLPHKSDYILAFFISGLISFNTS